MIKIIDNCCSPEYLKVLMDHAINSENWNMKYPHGHDTKFFKLDVIENGQVKIPILAGLSMGLFIQIYGMGGSEFFIPEIVSCGISMKDKHTPNNLHTDTEAEDGVIKIIGVLNNDWEERWGGGFIHGGKSNYIEPTSFCIFDPSELHSAAEILTDKKRFGSILISSSSELSPFQQSEYEISQVRQVLEYIPPFEIFLGRSIESALQSR